MNKRINFSSLNSKGKEIDKARILSVKIKKHKNASLSLFRRKILH